MSAIERIVRKIIFFGLIVLLTEFESLIGATRLSGGLEFEISFPAEVHSGPITGRVYVIISKKNHIEPRFQTGITGVPIWGKNIFSLKPDSFAVIDDKTFGYPLRSIMDIPPGRYFVQGFINVYTRFERSDGHTVWLHKDRWEGQQWNRSPGNLYSDVVEMFIDPCTQGKVRIICNKVIPPIKMVPDTKWVKHIRFRSKILTDFWGQPMYLGATILLPKGYDTHPDVFYPVNYIQSHFSLRAPYGFTDKKPAAERVRRRGGYEFYRFWTSDECPRIIAVTLQHPCPYYDDSYGVNSPNVGPYGDAIMKELIPYIEEHFRIIQKPYARILSGGSTGGWISLAFQIFYPDFFGGVFSSCPDPVDFRAYQIVNIYKDKNAYFNNYEWMRVERPACRRADGNIVYSMKDENHYELVIGDRTRGGGQWDIWEAAFGPIGEDGYPKPLWNKLTGEIDREVAEYMKQHFDLRYYLEKNWSWLGPKLVGKLHIFTGSMDSYYLNNGVVFLEEFLENTKDPYYKGTIEYGRRRPHCWGPYGERLVRLIGDYISKNCPEEEKPIKWNYK